MSAEKLQELAKPHYDRIKEILREVVVDIAKRQPGRNIDILEVGPGSKSILLKSLETKASSSSNYNLHANKMTIRIVFVDRDNLTTIGGKRIHFSFTAKSEDSYKMYSVMYEGQLVKEEFNRYLKNRSGEGQRTFDLIVIHGTLHEMYIEASEEAADGYFTDLFKRLHGMLKNGGQIFFGDPYYPPYYTSAEAHSVVDFLRNQASHGNAPVAMMHPEYLLSLIIKMQEHRFKLLRDEQAYYGFEGQDFGQKFYLVLLEKAEANG